MSQEKFWTLLSKRLAQEATASELLELEALIVEHPEWQYAVQNIEDLWQCKAREDDLQAEDAFHLHLHRMKEKNIPFEEQAAKTVSLRTFLWRKNWHRLVGAAALVITSLLGLFFLGKGKSGSGSPAREVTEVSTRAGSKSKIELPDGSVVWLNSGSRLTYEKDFGKERREVNLDGEGYFDVVKDKEKPFIIHTSNINIRVLGTLFNVKAYAQDGLTETSLIRGSIEVTIRNRPADKIILSPSEKLIVENNGIRKKELTADARTVKLPAESKPLISLNKLTYNESDSTVAETEWVKNRLVFRDESFEELAVRMQRWYNVTIEIRDPDLQKKRLTGIFETETIDQALEALKLSIPFKYEQTGNTIIIHP